jgi:hypothetical protein
MTIPENFKSLKANCLQIGEFDCHWSLFTPVIVIGCITVISITYYEEVINRRNKDFSGIGWIPLDL